MAARKRRATYPKEIRKEAKEKQHGLCTVSVEFANGELLEEQGTVGVEQAAFAKWAMAMIFCEEVRNLPDLENVIRGMIDAQEHTN